MLQNYRDVLNRYLRDQDVYGPSPITVRTWIFISLVFVAYASMLTWSDLFCQMHNADSLLPAIMSRMKVTWYVWGQNRLGNLLPFIAHPVHDINLNYTVQVFLQAFFAFFTLMAVFELLGTTGKYLWIQVMLAIAAAFWLFEIPAIKDMWLDSQPYGTSGFFLFWSLWVHRHNRYDRSVRSALLTTAMLSLLLAAFYVNTGLAIFLLPFSFIYLVAFPNTRNLIYLSTAMVALVVCALHSLLIGGGHNYYFVLELDLDHLRNSIAGLWVRISGIALAGHAASILIGLVIVQSIYSRLRRADEPVIDTFTAKSVICLAALIIYFLIVAHLQWTRLNLYSSRYFTIAFVMLSAVAAAIVVKAAVMLHAWSTLGRGARVSTGLRRLPGAAVLTVAVTAIASFAVYRMSGPPAEECLFVDIVHRPDVELLTDRAMDYRASFIVGEYWTVWPTVFATTRARDRSEQLHDVPVYGITPRGEVMRKEIGALIGREAPLVAICIDSDPDACVHQLLQMQPHASAWSFRTAVIEEGTLPRGRPYMVLELNRQLGS